LFNDIAFCDGKVYGLVRDTKLFMFVRTVKERGWLMLTATYQLGMNQLPAYTRWPRSQYDICWMNYVHSSYIVRHDDNLLMALRVRWSRH
jgi:hypothetical protein